MLIFQSLRSTTKSISRRMGHRQDLLLVNGYDDEVGSQEQFHVPHMDHG